MDTVKVNNETELTSTMGNVLSTSIKDEKSDTGDATPTSSTDANITTTSSQIVSDDPISSTSSDVIEQMKPKTSASAMNKLSDEDGKVSSMDQEADLLEMSMTDVTVSNEKITEDVEDLVHDLESLLGESTSLYNIPIKQQKEDGSSTPPDTLDKEQETDTRESASPKPETTVKVSAEDEDNKKVEDADYNKSPTVVEESSSTPLECPESEKIGDNVESSSLLQDSLVSKETCDVKEECDLKSEDFDSNKLCDARDDTLVEKSPNTPQESIDNKETRDVKAEDPDINTSHVEADNVDEKFSNGSQKSIGNEESDVKTEDTDSDKSSDAKTDAMVDESSNVVQECNEKCEIKDVKADSVLEEPSTMLQEVLKSNETCVGNVSSIVIDENEVVKEDSDNSIVSGAQADTPSSIPEVETETVYEELENVEETQPDIINGPVHCSENVEEDIIHKSENQDKEETESSDDKMRESCPSESNNEEISLDIYENKNCTVELEGDAKLDQPEKNDDETDLHEDGITLENPETKIEQEKEVGESVNVAVTESGTDTKVESDNVDTSITIEDNAPNTQEINEAIDSADGTEIDSKQDQYEDESKQDNPEVETVEDNPELDSVEDNSKVCTVEENPEGDLVECNPENETVQAHSEVNNQDSVEVKILDNTELQEQETVEHETTQNYLDGATVEDNPEEETVENNPEVATVENEPENKTVEDSAEEETVENNPEGATVENDPENETVEDSAEEETVENNPEVATVENEPENETVEDSAEEETVENNPEGATVENDPENETVENNSGAAIIEDSAEEETVEVNREVATVEVNTGVGIVQDDPEDKDLSVQDNPEVESVGDNVEIEIIQDETVEVDPEVQTVQDNLGVADQESSEVAIQDDTDLKEQDNPEEENTAVETVQESLYDEVAQTTSEDIVVQANSGAEIVQDNRVEVTVEANFEVENVQAEMQTVENISQDNDHDIPEAGIQEQDNPDEETHQENPEVETVQDHPEVEIVEATPESDTLPDNPEVETVQDCPGDELVPEVTVVESVPDKTATGKPAGELYDNVEASEVEAALSFSNIEASPQRLAEGDNEKIGTLPTTEVENGKIFSEGNDTFDLPAEMETVQNSPDKDMIETVEDVVSSLGEESETVEHPIGEDLNSGSEETTKVSEVVVLELEVDDKASLTEPAIVECSQEVEDCHTSQQEDTTDIAESTEEEACPSQDELLLEDVSPNLPEELPEIGIDSGSTVEIIEMEESMGNKIDNTGLVTNINEIRKEVDQNIVTMDEIDQQEEKVIENVQSSSDENIVLNNHSELETSSGEIESAVSEPITTSTSDISVAIIDTETKQNDEITNEVIPNLEQISEKTNGELEASESNFVAKIADETDDLSETGDSNYVPDKAMESGVSAENIEQLEPSEDDQIVDESLESVAVAKIEIVDEIDRLSAVANEDTTGNVELTGCLDKAENIDNVENMVDCVVESTVLLMGDDSDEEMVPILALEPEEEPIVNSEAVEENDKLSDKSEVAEQPSSDRKSTKVLKESLKKNQKISVSTKKKSGISKIVKPVDETILAVANLEKIEALENTENIETRLSEKEKIEMEALRKAVESITGISETVYEVDELVKEVDIPEEVTESVEKNHVLSNDCDKTNEIVESSIEIHQNSKANVSDENVRYNDSREVVNDKIDLEISPDSSQTVSESESLSVNYKEKESKTKTTDKPKRHRKTISESKLEELSINVDVSERDKAYSPKITIKPIRVPDEEVSTTSNSDSEVVKGSLKMTITKQSDKMHSILKICDPDNSEAAQETEEHIPKLKIKPIVQSVEQHSPKMATRSSKHLYSPTSSTQRSSSPRITIKPVVKPDKQEPVNPLKIKIGVSKSDEKSAGKHGNKPVKPEEEAPKEAILSPMKVVIKPIVKPVEEIEQVHSPRITIKPLPKKEVEKETSAVTKLNIKIKKIDDEVVDAEQEKERSSPKIIIKPIVKPQEPDAQAVEADEENKARIVLKINKGNLPSSTKESKKREHSVDDEKPEKVKVNKGNIPTSTKDSKKREHPLDDDKAADKVKVSKVNLATLAKKREHPVDDDKVEKLKISRVNLATSAKDTKKREHSVDDDKSEKLAKITVKFSKGGGHPHIVQQTEETHRRTHEEPSPEKHKKHKVEAESSIATRTRHKEVALDVSMEKSKHKEATGEPSPDESKHKDAAIEPKQIDSSETTKSKLKESEVSSSEPRVKHKDLIAEAPNEAKRAKKDKDAESYSPPANSGKADEEDVKIIDSKLDSPIVISEDSRSQDSGSCIIIEDPKDTSASGTESELQMTPDTAKSSPAKVDSTTGTPTGTPTPAVPRKRGRPRKVPLEVREDFKDSEEPSPQKKDAQKVHESGRPKRSCRGQSARDTLGIKPRKPRGAGRGRGSKRGMGSRGEPERDGKLAAVNFESMQSILQAEVVQAFGSSIVEESQSVIAQHLQVESELDIGEKFANPADSTLVMPVSNPSEASNPVVSEASNPVVSEASIPVVSEASNPVVSEASNPVVSEALAVSESTGNPDVSTTSSGPSEIVMVDEDTRMSADTNSRAQTPAKQMVAPADMAMVEESQSSIQSSATTESGKTPSSRSNKAPRLEVQEPEGSVISADQLTEYYWNGNGPFMLQEQVAQFLGIKSFKRKYPGIKRRMLEMQERDFIRESGLASEHMCDLGLTAVNSADILDIMYSDFQEKYEEYCKHQRDRQAKELINKQKALSLAASHEKSKADITDQAVQSAAQWNAMFNKTRKEQRRACMDLQTLTVHYPKGRIKQIPRAKVGHYPVALVPGQFTDYYKEFTPTEVNNLPLNTMLYDPINIVRPGDSDDSGSDGSDSDSDSSSSSSGSDSDSSSGIEDCKLCKHSGKKISPTK